MSGDPDVYVARLVTDEELLLNAGSQSGIALGDYFEILDASTRDVPDPRTGRILGSIDRVKAKVIVTEVADNLALATVVGRNYGISTAARILSGDPPAVRQAPDRWREGVEIGDPARPAGRRTTPPRLSSSEADGK